MSVNSYLQSLAHDIHVEDNEENRIEVSISTIKARLQSYFGDQVDEKKVFGSYDRDTILARKSDDESDVDLMVVFSNPYGYKPQTFLNKLKEFANYYYSTSEIYQSSPTNVLELRHIKFELVPAQKRNGFYYIPDNSSDWQWTDPDSLKDRVNTAHRNNGYKVKPILRLMKHWNVNKNYRDMASFSLEDTVAQDLQYAYVTCTSYTDYLKKAFMAIKYKTNSYRVQLAIGRIDKALEYESDGMPYSALLEIKKVFPEV